MKIKLSLSLSLVFALLVGTVPLAAAEVPTVRIEAQALGASVPVEATIEAVRQATLAAQVAGRVLDLRVDAGDRVRAGDLLLSIDAAEAVQAVAGAQAGVAQAEANRIKARADFDRSRSLFERKFISQSGLDQARTALDAAEAQLRAAQAGRGQASTVQGYTRIAAPISGVVSARHVEPGEMAQPGRELVTIHDPAALRAVADVSQQRIAALGGGALKARIELPDSGRWIDATAVTVLPSADARTHTVRVRVDLPLGIEGVVPGSFARVHFVSAERSRLVVPAAAVVRRGELTAVYVADDKGGFSLRQLRLGEALGDGAGAEGGIEVLAGLRGGETIALDPVQAGIFAHGANRR
ncbi:MAG: efflux RND transporter periplasmic adaptor subunit [Azoarcus sp.]|nr:efflux RND transporter periplasmic adaptor subunit [Azoarcus sp.]